MSTTDIKQETISITHLEESCNTDESNNKNKKNRKRKVKDYISCKFFIPHKKRYCNARPHKGLCD